MIGAERINPSTVNLLTILWRFAHHIVLTAAAWFFQVVYHKSPEYKIYYIFMRVILYLLFYSATTALKRTADPLSNARFKRSKLSDASRMWYKTVVCLIVYVIEDHYLQVSRQDVVHTRRCDRAVNSWWRSFDVRGLHSSFWVRIICEISRNNSP